MLPLHLPNLFPWTLWCYGQLPLLLHSLSIVGSESGVQQGDPLQDDPLQDDPLQGDPLQDDPPAR